ncbi:MULTISPECIES: hypothetical protein [unclassified Paenibacillus]|uniref:hypothetical protein n=1 Tax=unclassified Paenibacillus TaxID=185978 RepID=UPI00089CA444|nr:MULTISPECIES: hypothetical protein [unclassified Paenibacillus]OMC67319.1 hypothetical protein BK126_17090 [Paenibacillus sp. FSL H7-0326]SDW70591.1 hypothetical protein SAMN05518848_102751 [Paenibacillus sp. PDC88]
MRLRTLVLLSIILGFLLAAASPMLDSKLITDAEQLNHHELGLPFPFLVQHTTLTPMEGAFPFELGLLDPREHPSSIIPFSYFLNGLFYSGTVCLILWIANRVYIIIRR